MSLPAAPERAGRVWLLPPLCTGSEAVPRDPLKDGVRLGRFGGALGYLPLPELAQHAIMRLISDQSLLSIDIALDRHLGLDRLNSRVPCPDSGISRYD
jgi:hypothetical protein